MTQIANLKIKFTGPVKIVYLFRRKGNYSQDVDNAICSINDILQDAGIIDDDKNIISGTFNVVQNNPEWSTLITIDSLDTDLAKR
jgi:Holliday junction resolvase RusA-like endonuclease